jgi:hypothetical protein
VGFSEALLLFHVTHFRINLFCSMFGVEAVSEDSDGSDGAPSQGETQFPSLSGICLSWGFSRVTGDPDTFRHCLDGRAMMVTVDLTSSVIVFRPAYAT